METDEHLVQRLRDGDEEAFRELIRRHHGRLLGLARTFAGNSATAEEVVQDTWLAVIEGLPTLSRPSSLKSWIYTILANKARRRAQRDNRTSLFPDMGGDDDADPAPDSDRFTKRGFRKEPVALWDSIDPERIVAGQQLWAHVRRAMKDLPPGQQAVVMLRDVEGLSAAEACAVLDIDDARQRVLLHRARTKLRQALDILLAAPER